MRVCAWWTFADFVPQNCQGWTVAVVDCLRATTSVAAALCSGAAGVWPAAEETEARTWSSERGAILAGERHCLPPPGFDLGNSPQGFTPEAVRGRDVVLWTTNGSRALARAREAGGEVLAFALANVGAVAAHLGRARPSHLALVCAGTEGEFSLEDAFATGALLSRLGRGEEPLDMDERAQAARMIYLAGQDDPRGVLAGTRAAAKLRAQGLEADVLFAAAQDTLPVVPLWSDGALRAVR